MKGLRVALFTDADVFAGTERHIFDLARGLRDAGLEVVVACPTPAPLAEKASSVGIEVVSVQKQGLIDRAAVRTLVELLQSHKADIIHAHNGRTMLSSALAVTLARRGKAVATQHFLEPDHTSHSGPKAVVYHAAHRWVSSRTAGFIAISEAVRDKMRERGDAPDKKIAVVPNGITPPDQSHMASPALVRAELGLDADTPLVVCAARLEREKDVGSLIQAFKGVLIACPSAVCVVAGEGSQQETLQVQIRELGLLSSVRLLGFREDVEAIMQAGDVFVLPSLAEPFGLVLLEAMALGKPVIATKAGGPLEIVVHEETGLLVPPSEPEALSQAILRLINDPQNAQTMGRKGLTRFQERYTVTCMAQAICGIYERMI